MKTTGDAFLVLFGSPARAVRGAPAMIDAATVLDLTSRAPVHTGEVQLYGEEVRGIAVHTAARILTAAKPGEILASRPSVTCLQDREWCSRIVASSSSKVLKAAGVWQRSFGRAHRAHYGPLPADD
jgi:class 3 adenylate cyclase